MLYRIEFPKKVMEYYNLNGHYNGSYGINREMFGMNGQIHEFDCTNPDRLIGKTCGFVWDKNWVVPLKPIKYSKKLFKNNNIFCSEGMIKLFSDIPYIIYDKKNKIVPFDTNKMVSIVPKYK